MKWLAAIAFVIIVAPANAEVYVPKSHNSMGTVCVERIEDQGVANIYRVTLVISEGLQEVSFLGGMAVCVYLDPGTQRLALDWPKFDWNRTDHGSENSIHEKSPEISVSMKPSGMIAMEICSKRDKYKAPHWLLRYRGGKVSCDDES